MTNKTYEVRVGRIEITVPHEGRDLTFVSPSKGPDFYVNVMGDILQDGLKTPSGEYTASLVHAVYCGPEEFRDNPQVKDMRDIMKNRWLCVANRNLWIPENHKNSGVFVVYDEEGVGRTEELNQGELEKVLENGEEFVLNGTTIKVSKDRRVRFASRDSYEGGVQSPETFAKNGFVIASYLGGADKLADASKTFRGEPAAWVRNLKTPEQRVSALCGYVGGLHVYGNVFVDSYGGHAFGVL